MNGLTRTVFRNLVRARRDEVARQHIGKPHVEFCSECGKACDRTGRRNMSICFACSKKRREQAS